MLKDAVEMEPEASILKYRRRKFEFSETFFFVCREEFQNSRCG